MLIESTSLLYPILTLMSTGKRSFENMGLLIQRSGDTVKRLLKPAKHSFLCSQTIGKSIFNGKRKLFVAIDDTLLKKIHSQFMWGAGRFYDTKIGRRIMAYRLVIGIISDGKVVVPIDAAYLFSKELIDQIPEEKFQTKDEIAIAMVEIARSLFHESEITVVVDGLYSTVKFLEWCKTNNIRMEARMHSNRVVEYKGKRIKLKDLLQVKGMRPKGRQMARTIPVKWHNIELEITIVRRFDKKGSESIVFQAATYKALPREHVANYKKRWRIEMLNRTAKQSLGIAECFSTERRTQHNHIAAVLLAYALAQLEMKTHGIKTPEAAIRSCKTKTVAYLIDRFDWIIKSFAGGLA